MNDYWYPDWTFYAFVHTRMIQEFGGYTGLEYSSKWFLVASIKMFNEIITQVKDLNKCLTHKAALMLTLLARNRIWADGQKRTAYSTTKTFLELNGETMFHSDPDEINKFMKNLTFKYTHDQVKKWIRDGHVPL